jgi:hypothetical protein
MLINKIQEPTVADTLLFLFDARLIGGKVFGYRDMYLHYDAELRRAKARGEKKPEKVAKQLTASKFNCVPRTISNIIKIMSSPVPEPRKRF